MRCINGLLAQDVCCSSGPSTSLGLEMSGTASRCSVLVHARCTKCCLTGLTAVKRPRVPGWNRHELQVSLVLTVRVGDEEDGIYGTATQVAVSVPVLLYMR